MQHKEFSINKGWCTNDLKINKWVKKQITLINDQMDNAVIQFTIAHNFQLYQQLNGYF